MIKGSVGGQCRTNIKNRSKSTKKRIQCERALETDTEILVKIRFCLFEDDGSDKNVLKPCAPLCKFTKNHINANIEFMTGAELDKEHIRSLKNVRRMAAPKGASFFTTGGCFGVADARFLVIRGSLETVDETNKENCETVTNAPINTSKTATECDDGKETESEPVLETAQENGQKECAPKVDQTSTLNEQFSSSLTITEPKPSVHENENENESGNDIIGYMRFFFTVEGDIVNELTGLPVIVIQDLFILPQFQRKGLGKHLLQICELICRSNHLNGIQLVVNKCMEETLHNFLTSKLKGYEPNDCTSFLDGEHISTILPNVAVFSKAFRPIV